MTEDGFITADELRIELSGSSADIDSLIRQADKNGVCSYLCLPCTTTIIGQPELAFVCDDAFVFPTTMSLWTSCIIKGAFWHS